MTVTNLRASGQSIGLIRCMKPTDMTSIAELKSVGENACCTTV